MTAAAIQPACDRAIAASLQYSEAVAVTHPRFVLATMIIASSLSFIDGSVVNVGLPAIGSSLGVDGGGLSWVINSYLLPLSALLLIGGAAGDLYGRRRSLKQHRREHAKAGGRSDLSSVPGPAGPLFCRDRAAGYMLAVRVGPESRLQKGKRRVGATSPSPTSMRPFPSLATAVLRG